MGMVEQPIDEAVLEAAVHAGVYAYVEWTASTDKLYRAVRAAYTGEPYFDPPWVYMQMTRLFDRLNLEARGIVQIGMLQLKLDERQTYLGNQRLALTCLEFDVLLCLARHAGHVVTHDELLRKVWGCDLNSGGTINQVNCCIKRLRRKLGSDGPTYIITVRGIGYRMLTETEWRVRMRKS
jgi:DNA-binding response OmpR family regulator